MEKEYIYLDEKISNRFKIREINRERNYTHLYGKNFKGNLEYENVAMWEAVDKIAKKYPDYIAIEYFETKITYNELMRLIRNCAKMLKSYGADKGERITIAMANTPEAIISFYASNMVGLIPVMIHPKSSKTFIEGCLRKTKSKFIVALNNCLSNVKEIIDVNSDISQNIKKVFCVSPKDSMSSPVLKILYQLTKTNGIKNVYDNRFISFNNALKKSNHFNKEYITSSDGGDRAAIIFSGGTTNNPKAILHSNNGFNTLSKASFVMCDCLEPGDKMLLVIPLFHGFGLEIGIHATLTNGMHVILEPEPNITRIAKIFKKKTPQLFMAVPKLLNKMYDSGKFNKIDYSNVKMFISGGASLSPSLKKQWDSLLKKYNPSLSIREGYGSAQMIAGTCINPKNNPKSGSIGIPLPDVYYKIVKPNSDIEVSIGEIGELCVCGEFLMEGYIKEPKNSNSELEIDKKMTSQDLRIHSDGYKWLHTHDLVRQTEDSYYEWIQRCDFIISNKEGNLINPRDIEECLDKQDIINSAVAFGLVDSNCSDKNSDLVACISLKDKEEQNNAMQSIYNNLSTDLAKYQMPKKIFVVSEIPETLVGKPNVREIKSAIECNKMTGAEIYMLTEKGYILSK